MTVIYTLIAACLVLPLVFSNVDTESTLLSKVSAEDDQPAAKK